MSNTLTALGMIVIDVMIIASVVAIIKLNISKRTKRIGILGTILGVLSIGVYALYFFKQYRAWNNFNAALFNTSKPWLTAVICVCALLVFSVVQKLDSRKSQNIDEKTNGIENQGNFAKPGCQIALPITVNGMLLMTVFVAPFIEVFANNRTEFDFAFKNIVIPLLAGVVIWLVLSVCIFMLLNENADRLFVSIIWSVGIMSYVQGLFLNGNLFIMDGKDMEWSAGLVMGNLLIWIVVILTLTALLNIKRIGRKDNVVSKFSDKILIYSSAFFMAIQIVGLISLVPGMLDEVDSDADVAVNYLSTQGIDEVAIENNVIVFVLDTYDVDFYEEVKAANPKFYAPLSDFTFYPDTVSQFSRTYPSVPYMLSHMPYFYEEPKREYVDKAFGECDFWNKLSNEGYATYIFEDDKQCIGEPVLSVCSNFCAEGHVLSERDSFIGTIEAVGTIGAYRQLPYLAKASLGYTSDSINKLVIDEKVWDNAPYAMDDAALIDSVRKTGLSMSEDKNAFRFIHMMGAHAPYIIDSLGNEITDRIVEPVEQYQGCMQYVYLYLEELKRLGKYDDTTVIITADHGKNFVAEELPNKTNPILMIKLPNAKGTSADGPIVSDTKATLEDILPTIAGTLNIDYDGNGVGCDLTKGVDDNRVRYHYFAVVEDTNQTGTLKYEIDGSSNEFDSWKNIGEYHKFGEYYE